MYKVLTIDGKDYKLEYTVEASLYNDAVTSLVDYLSGVSTEQNFEEGIKKMTNLPKVALICFYSGLLEYHSDEIRSIEDAKVLVKKYFNETKSNFYDLFNIIVEQMDEDGFFEQIGIAQLSEAVANMPTTQDHKKPTNRSKK